MHAFIFVYLYLHNVFVYLLYEMMAQTNCFHVPSAVRF